ncbi:hypothetical protein AMK59_7895 [Oryctes borbonicus]|uniref:DBP10 C-terminal domain-containing protein n=1 Tax=Oryctes borbonicus TaxID=1629725 RepID=A0A0T6AZK1_9SCAR|nr:hypothetical protein AMK59_7895 [Oryctes borbonicus]
MCQRLMYSLRPIQEATKVQFDLTGDSEDMIRTAKQIKKWDRKKKKMVTINVGNKEGKIRTESGAWISATYKSNRYNQWKEKTKAAENADSDEDDDRNEQKNIPRGKPNTHWARHNEKTKLKQKQSELKSNDQILKQRLIAEKKKQKQRGKKRTHKKRKK